MVILSIDYGDVRTGLAISDRSEMAVNDVPGVKADGFKKTLEAVAEKVAALRPELIVVGNPINMDGSKGWRSEKAEAFAAELAEKTGVPVKMYDERLTTMEAHKILSENNVRGRKRKAVVDSLSARLILEDYMRARKNRLASDKNG